MPRTLPPHLALALLAFAPGLGAQSQAVLPEQRLNVGGWTGQQATADLQVAVAEHDGMFAALWVDGSPRDILFKRSLDGGLTWGDQTRLDFEGAPHQHDSDLPRLLFTDSGTLVAAYRSTNGVVRVRYSSDGGLTWSDDPWTAMDQNVDFFQLVNEPGTEHVHLVYSDAFSGGVFWRSRVSPTAIPSSLYVYHLPSPLAPYEFDVTASNGRMNIAVPYFMGSSIDLGLLSIQSPEIGGLPTFTVESQTSGSSAFPAIASDGDHVLACWWESSSPGASNTTLHAMASNDGGASWGPEFTVSVQAESTAGANVSYPTCEVRGDDMFIGYSDDSQSLGTRKAYLARSHDAGATWSFDQPLDAGSPRSSDRVLVQATSSRVFTHLETTTTGPVVTAYSVSYDSGATFSPPVEVPNPLGDAEYGYLFNSTPLAVSDSTHVAMSAFWDGSNPGARELYVAGLETTLGSAYCFGAGCPCANDEAAGGCRNSTGGGATLSGTGNPSVSSGSVVLSAIGLPAGAGLYFQGADRLNGGAGLVFGDGLRCAGGSVVRLEVVVASGGASATTSDLAAKGGVAAGDVRRYQLWYRDVFGSPCGANYNLTNGYEFAWAP